MTPRIVPGTAPLVLITSRRGIEEARAGFFWMDKSEVRRLPLCIGNMRTSSGCQRDRRRLVAEEEAARVSFHQGNGVGGGLARFSRRGDMR
jgi:hypothetical protein